jgi:hypothetical protein
MDFVKTGKSLYSGLLLSVIMKLIDVGRDEKCTAVSNLGRRDKINKRMNANVKKKKTREKEQQ